MKQLILEALLPIIGAIAAIVLPTVLTLATNKFSQLTGLQIEAQRREALQSALANAARILLSGTSSKSTAVEYVRRSVPQALTFFDIDIDDDDRISELLAPHVAAQASQTTKPANV
ncbi:hypothetical protein IFT84_10240 [Rhizobium sp. CFBP 8762]|uniref:hypothetical protein n=1 Tax=Rhizobium sp. CFBP 8762 TaxID=2775279 RepID=UPI00177C0532|nr:hypothetical protein [Rhizobium sp. CFBP 8762]MBD8554902.1 hypothetical protein [Rhizobium sp. CFBP 8762]